MFFDSVKSFPVVCTTFLSKKLDINRSYIILNVLITKFYFIDNL